MKEGITIQISFKITCFVVFFLVINCRSTKGVLIEVNIPKVYVRPFFWYFILCVSTETSLNQCCLKCYFLTFFFWNLFPLFSVMSLLLLRYLSVSDRHVHVGSLSSRWHESIKVQQRSFSSHPKASSVLTLSWNAEAHQVSGQGHMTQEMAFTWRCLGRILHTVIGWWKLLLWPSSLKTTLFQTSVFSS